MHLKLQELQRVVKQTVKEERSNKAICEELLRVLGPSIMVSSKPSKIVEAANERLDVLESTGRSLIGRFKLSVLNEAAQSSSQSVRKLAARLLPEKYAVDLLNDQKSSVRCAAAKRLPYGLIKESLRRHPSDDQLRTIANMKKLDEAGLPLPDENDQPFDMYGDEPLGDAVKTRKDSKFSSGWYDRLAEKLVDEYGTNLEGHWEEVLVSRVVSSYLSTGIHVDHDKLLKAIMKIIREREDLVIKEGSLKGLARRLFGESYFDTAAFPVLEEDTKDPVQSLLESNFSSSQYIDEAERVFQIKKSYLPSGIKKYRLGEGYNGVDTQVPMRAYIPKNSSASSVERALDTYVSNWNRHQAMVGEPYKLSWSHYPADVSLIGFILELK